MTDSSTGPGIVVVDKPAGMTSHDVVGRCRRIFGTRRVGHAGTLDPMATGVLVIGVDRATKILGLLTAASKSYDATIRLGQSTSTEDAEGTVLQQRPAEHLTDGAIAAVIADLCGDIEQVPSAVSAVKVGGRRAYRLVREGHSVDLPARPVRVDRFEISAVRRSRVASRTSDPLSGLNIRLTYRTVRVLMVIAEQPGASNREIAEGSGIVDQGQISKLLTRLERLKLIRNIGAGQERGAANAWQLTGRGAEVERATRLL